MRKKLHESVMFQSPIRVSDGIGGYEEGWKDEFQVRADYKRLRGSEKVIASRLEGVQPTIVKVRNSENVRASNLDWRIIDCRTDEVFNIRSRIESDDRMYYDFTCESGVST